MESTAGLSTCATRGRLIDYIVKPDATETPRQNPVDTNASCSSWEKILWSADSANNPRMGAIAIGSLPLGIALTINSYRELFEGLKAKIVVTQEFLDKYTPMCGECNGAREVPGQYWGSGKCPVCNGTGGKLPEGIDGYVSSWKTLLGDSGVEIIPRVSQPAANSYLKITRFFKEMCGYKTEPALTFHESGVPVCKADQWIFDWQIRK